MIRQQLFTLLTLFGCLAPWITPRHFPVHTFEASHERQSVAASVSSRNEAQPLLLSRDFEPSQSIELAEQ
jgi:hypothetical protein